MIITTRATHYLYAEVRRLRARLASTLNDLHNLIAAARATLSADADGEPDPLYYLRDELEVQGQLPRKHRQERDHPRERP